MPRLVWIPMDDLGLTRRGGPVGCGECHAPVSLMLQDGRLFIICDKCRILGHEIVDGDFADSDPVFHEGN